MNERGYDRRGGDRRGGDRRGGDRRGGGGHRGRGGRGGFRGGGGRHHGHHHGERRSEGHGHRSPRVEFTPLEQVTPIGTERTDSIFLSAIPAVRHLAYASLIKSAGKDTGYTLIITEETTEAENISRSLGNYGIATLAIRAERSGTARPSQPIRANVVIGTASGILGAFDRGSLEAEKIHTVVLDQHKAALRHGELEELMHLLPELSGVQVVAGTESVNDEYQAFSQAFLKNPQTVDLSTLTEESIKAATAAAPEAPEEHSHKEYSDAEPTERHSEEHAEAPAMPREEGATGEGCSHQFFDLPADLLAKPNALCDLVEADPSAKILCFCGSPADADLTEALLRKRGVPARKLVGFVHPGRIRGASEDFAQGKARVLVVTDVAAKRLSLPATTIVNYSFSEEPTGYATRLAAAHKATLAKVVSLVTPLDIAHFHFLKKSVSFEFVPGTLPSPEDLAKAKFQDLVNQAEAKNAASDARWSTYTKLVLEHARRDEIVAFLLANTLEALPQAIAAQGARRRDDRAQDSDDRRDHDRGNRRDGGSEHGGDSMMSDEDTQHADFGAEDRPFVPPLKDCRLYIGQGASQGVTEKMLTGIVEQSCEVPRADIRRVAVRKHYSFIDVPEERADEVEAKLSTHSLESGDRLFVRKATQISIPRDTADTGGTQDAANAVGTEAEQTAPAA